MRTLNIQFHMLLEELIDFVSDVSSQLAMSVRLERWFPDVVHDVPAGADVHDEVRKFGHIDRIWLIYTPPRCRKPGVFTLNIGKLKGTHLAQSQFGGGTRRPAAYEALKKAASELKRRTKAGVWTTTVTGNIGYVKFFRVSPGAAKASRSGKVELVGMAGAQSYRVDEPI